MRPHRNKWIVKMNWSHRIVKFLKERRCTKMTNIAPTAPTRISRIWKIASVSAWAGKQLNSEMHKHQLVNLVHDLVIYVISLQISWTRCKKLFKKIERKITKEKLQIKLEPMYCSFYCSYTHSLNLFPKL
jgi:hypothetical protein